MHIRYDTIFKSEICILHFNADALYGENSRNVCSIPTVTNQ